MYLSGLNLKNIKKLHLMTEICRTKNSILGPFSIHHNVLYPNRFPRGLIEKLLTLYLYTGPKLWNEINKTTPTHKLMKKCKFDLNLFWQKNHRRFSEMILKAGLFRMTNGIIFVKCKTISSTDSYVGITKV